MNYLLIDKGYYDYDYTNKEATTPVIATPLSDDKLHSILSQFGLGKKEMNDEEIQTHIINNLEKEE